MFKFIKYRDETRLQILSDSAAVFFGKFYICNQDEHLITLRNENLKYSVFGNGLYIAAVTGPKTVIMGKIERIEFI